MTIKKLENGDLIHSVLKAFFHGGPVINLEPLNDYSTCYFFRMNMIEEAIFNEFWRDRKARSVEVVQNQNSFYKPHLSLVEKSKNWGHL